MRGTYVIILKLKYILYQIRKSTKKESLGYFRFFKKSNQKDFQKEILKKNIFDMVECIKNSNFTNVSRPPELVNRDDIN